MIKSLFFLPFSWVKIGTVPIKYIGTVGKYAIETSVSIPQGHVLRAKLSEIKDPRKGH